MVTVADIDELRRIDRLDRSPDDLATLSALGWPNDSWHPITLAVATIAVPSAGIRAGDVLVHARAGEDQVRAIRGRVHGLSLSDYEALRRAVKEHDDALRDITPYPVCWWGTRASRFLNDRRQWGRRLKRWRSRLFVVRAFTHTVSAPVYAVSDEAAILDLLTDIGCRMPVVKGGAR